MAKASATTDTELLDEAAHTEPRPSAHDGYAAQGIQGTRAHRAAPRSRMPRVPLQPLVDEFLEEVAQTLAPATERAYRGPIMLYLTYLHERLDQAPGLADFTTETVRAWTTCLRSQPKALGGVATAGNEPISLASLRTYLRTLRVFANWLPKPPHRYCDESPLRYFKLPRGEETAKVPIEVGDLRKLLHAAEHDKDSVFGARSRALLLTLVDGGLRAREIAALTIGDVSLKEGVLVVRRSKGRKPRLIAVGGETVRALRRYALLREGLEKSDTSAQAPFFQTIHGTAFTYYGLRSWLHRLERDAGVPHVYLHLLRHTSALETLDAGADLRTVQLKLGHADIRTTQGYLNMAPGKIGELQRAFSPVDRLGLTLTSETDTTPPKRGTGRVRKSAAEPRLWRREPGGSRSGRGSA